MPRIYDRLLLSCSDCAFQKHVYPNNERCFAAVNHQYLDNHNGPIKQKMKEWIEISSRITAFLKAEPFWHR